MRYKLTKVKLLSIVDDIVEKKLKYSYIACDIKIKVISLHCQPEYLQPIITQYFIDNKSEIWLLFLIAHSKR